MMNNKQKNIYAKIHKHFVKVAIEKEIEDLLEFGFRGYQGYSIEELINEIYGDCNECDDTIGKEIGEIINKAILDISESNK